MWFASVWHAMCLQKQNFWGSMQDRDGGAPPGLESYDAEQLQHVHTTRF